jgi:phosphopantothenoylcysteine decarboxylase/phosphopantothenate--cysteine ligase
MGFAIAEAAIARGATVTVVSGFTSVEPPAGATTVRVQTAAEMHAAVMNEIENATVFIGAAAVADYRPSTRADNKIKKSEDVLNLALERTEDILGDVAAHRNDRLLVVGFAAETNDIIQNARKKLVNKKLDLLIANDVTKEGAGFDATTNIISIISSDNDEVKVLPLMSKLEAAGKILDEVVRLRSGVA